LKRFFAVLFFSWLAVLLVLTYWPDLPDIKVRFRGEWFRTDYLGHLGFYTVLTALFLLWRTGWRRKVSTKLLILTIIGGLLLGTLTEITQLFIPDRAMNPTDLVYNSVGILLGAGAVTLVGRR